jgi:hypothetical protein
MALIISPAPSLDLALIGLPAPFQSKESVRLLNIPIKTGVSRSRYGGK